MANDVLIFVRHSQVERVAGVDSAEWRLSATGRTLARELAAELRPWAPTRMITSVEPKAAETGQIIADALAIPCTSAPDLHEHDRRGMAYIPSREAFMAQVARFFAEPDQQVMGNETANEAKRRFVSAVGAQQAAYPNDTLAIATHGTVLSLFLAAHNPDLDLLAFWQALPLPHVLAVDAHTYRLLP